MYLYPGFELGIVCGIVCVGSSLGGGAISVCRQLPAPTSLGGGAIRSLLGTAVEGPTSSRYKCPVNKFTCDDEKKPLSDKAARWHTFVNRRRSRWSW